jgi:hypothetical protein
VPTPLPIAACTLDAAGAAEQARRYARLGEWAEEIARDDRRLEVRFGAEFEAELVEETVEIERDCCAFFEIAWQPEQRRLTFEAPYAGQAVALDAIAEALGAGSAETGAAA